MGRNLAGPQGLSRSCAHGVVQSKTTIGNAGILGGTAPMPSDFCLLHLRTTDEKVGRDRARPSLIKGAMKLVAAALFSAQKPKKSRTSTMTRHLSWSVNIFYDFIHALIHSFGGCVRRSFGRSLNREFGELGSSAGDRTGCAVSNKRRGSGSI